MEKMKPSILATKKEEKSITKYCIQFKTIEDLEGLISQIKDLDGVDINSTRTYASISVGKSAPDYESIITKIDGYLKQYAK